MQADVPCDADVLQVGLTPACNLLCATVHFCFRHIHPLSLPVLCCFCNAVQLWQPAALSLLMSGLWLLHCVTVSQSTLHISFSETVHCAVVYVLLGMICFEQCYGHAGCSLDVWYGKHRACRLASCLCPLAANSRDTSFRTASLWLPGHTRCTQPYYQDPQVSASGIPCAHQRNDVCWLSWMTCM